VIELRTFGALDLRAPGGRELRTVIAQPKRFALLVYLAAAAPGPFHRRDTLLAYFWPEMDAARGRAALSRAIHYLRGALGHDVIVSRGDEEIGLSADQFGSDAARMRALYDAHRFADAVALYRGDFLSGFFVSDAPELERWIETERERFRAMATDAARRLSDEADAAHDPTRALHWARLASAFAPYDEPALRRTLELLERMGDRAAAADVFRHFAERLRDDLSIEPSVETRALMASMLAHTPTPAAPARAAAPANVASRPPKRSKSSRAVLAGSIALTSVVLGASIAWNIAHARRLPAESPPAATRRTPPAGTRATDPTTYDLYLWGRYYWNGRTRESLARAVVFFQRAIARDSTYAPAYSGLAEAQALLVVYGVPASELMPNARAAAERALALDEAQSEAHAALGYIAMTYEWNWPAAERELLRALALDPSNATAHHWYSMLLAVRQRVPESIAEIDSAYELDPAALLLRGALGNRYFLARDYERARSFFEPVVRVTGDSLPSYLWLTMIYLRLGRIDDALHLVESRHAGASASPDKLAVAAMTYAAAGRAMDARRIMRTLERRAAQHAFVPGPTWVARAYAALGERERAFAWLARAMAQHDDQVAFVQVDPLLDPLRGDARFHAVVVEMGLE
jgi:DNA-binding SARP family transcriptional activator